jgi:hypothetical protein
VHAFFLCTCLASFAAAQADEPVDEPSFDGAWELTFYQGLREGNYVATHWLIDLRTNAGKLDGRVVATSPALKGSDLDQVRWEKGRLRLTFTPNAQDQKTGSGAASAFEFDGVPASKPEEGILGRLQAGTEVYPAQLLPTKKRAFEKNFSGRQSYAPLEKVSTTLEELKPIRNSVARQKISREAGTRNSYTVLDKAVPHLEKALRHSDGAAVIEAAKFLVRQGVALRQQADQLAPWARAGEQAARRYGPRPARRMRRAARCHDAADQGNCAAHP